MLVGWWAGAGAEEGGKGGGAGWGGGGDLISCPGNPAAAYRSREGRRRWGTGECGPPLSGEIQERCSIVGGAACGCLLVTKGRSWQAGGKLEWG